MVWTSTSNGRAIPSKTSLENGDQMKKTKERPRQRQIENLTNDMIQKRLRDDDAQDNNYGSKKIRIL